jgi:hypothetical protein
MDKSGRRRDRRNGVGVAIAKMVGRETEPVAAAAAEVGIDENVGGDGGGS